MINKSTSKTRYSCIDEEESSDINTSSIVTSEKTESITDTKEAPSSPRLREVKVFNKIKSKGKLTASKELYANSINEQSSELSMSQRQCENTIKMDCNYKKLHKNNINGKSIP